MDMLQQLAKIIYLGTFASRFISFVCEAVAINR